MMILYQSISQSAISVCNFVSTILKTSWNIFIFTEKSNLIVFLGVNYVPLFELFCVSIAYPAIHWGMWACSLFSFINLNAGFLRTSQWCLVCIYRLPLHCYSLCVALSITVAAWVMLWTCSLLLSFFPPLIILY